MDHLAELPTSSADQDRRQTTRWPGSCGSARTARPRTPLPATWTRTLCLWPKLCHCGVLAAVDDHLRRTPGRAELTAAPRAAHNPTALALPACSMYQAPIPTTLQATATILCWCCTTVASTWSTRPGSR